MARGPAHPPGRCSPAGLAALGAGQTREAAGADAGRPRQGDRMTAATTTAIPAGPDAALDQLPEPDFRVADLSLAPFGRKEIQLAEHEMPGLMALRREFGEEQPLRGARVTGSLHMTVQTAV